MYSTVPAFKESFAKLWLNPQYAKSMVFAYCLTHHAGFEKKGTRHSSNIAKYLRGFVILYSFLANLEHGVSKLVFALSSILILEFSFASNY